MGKKSGSTGSALPIHWTDFPLVLSILARGMNAAFDDAFAAAQIILAAHQRWAIEQRIEREGTVKFVDEAMEQIDHMVDRGKDG